MIDCKHLARIASVQPPVLPSALVRTQQRLGLTFPSQYIQLLNCSNGFAVPGVVSLRLYAIDELEERNAWYELDVNLPNWLLIGDDGGGRAILLDCSNEEGTVSLVGLGSLLPEDMKVIAPDIAGWMSKGFTLDAM